MAGCCAARAARAVLSAWECCALTGCPRARRPDQRTLCGLFEKHDGFLHCVRIGGIRRAAACLGPLSLWHVACTMFRAAGAARPV